MRRERPDHTLQPTALVHEAFLRLVRQERVAWRDSAHFFSVASQAMRRILVDHARARRADKRGGGGARVPLDGCLSLARDADVLAVDDALARLSEVDPRQAEIVSLRFFGGLSVEEMAAARFQRVTEVAAALAATAAAGEWDEARAEAWWREHAAAATAGHAAEEDALARTQAQGPAAPG